MKYRLIRFSADGTVALDATIDRPNQHGDNELWRDLNNGSALLYDYSTSRWYRLRRKDEQVFSTWQDNRDNPLPGYVEMIKLVGSL